MDRLMDQITVEEGTGAEALIRAMFNRKQANDLRQLKEHNSILKGGK